MEKELTPWLTITADGARFALKVDAKSLVTALLNMVKKPTDVVGNASEAFKTLKLTPNPANLAGFLMQRAMTQALQEIIAENRDRFPETLPDEDKVMAFYSQTSVQREPTFLDKDFLQQPHHLPYVREVGDYLKTWLGYFNVPTEDAKRLAEIRLPRLFLHALNDEWRNNSDFYKPILTANEGPFQAANEREYYWTQYRLHLQSEFEAKPMFDETFSLADVYVPLRAYTERPAKEKKTQYDRDDQKIRDVVSLEAAIADWLARDDNEDVLRVISGGPGSGKSSFGKSLASRLAGEGQYIVFVPLHLYDPKGDISAAVFEYLDEYGFLRHNPLDRSNGDTPLLLIFDGLDELAIQGNSSKEVAEDFVRALKEFLNQRNRQSLQIRVILSGREIIIQTHSSLLRGIEPLHVLPYFLLDTEINPRRSSQRSYRYEDPHSLLQEDQRETWWARYATAKYGKPAPMPEVLKGENLREITEQPLLNYLLALSYGNGRIDFQIEDNVNAIYADLLTEIYLRRYGGGNPIVPTLSPEEFAEMFEEIGQAVWHGSGRTASVESIIKHCGGEESPLLKQFKEGATRGVERTLVAFYIRRRDAHGTPTFEFTHKSFGEYLTARRIVHEMLAMHETLKSKRRPTTGTLAEEALIGWARVCGPTPLDWNRLDFLRREIALLHRSDNPDVPKVAELQRTLARLIGDMLRDGMPMHHTGLEIKTFGEMNRQARNAEETLLAAWNACARITEENGEIEWSDRNDDGSWKEPTKAGEWLRRLCGQRAEYGDDGPLAFDCLSFLRLRWVDLSAIDLIFANLTGADLTYAELFGANLIGANLTDANLTGANLMDANLKDANLMRTNLVNANLLNTNLMRTNLTRPMDLENARFLDSAYFNRERYADELERWRQVNSTDQNRSELIEGRPEDDKNDD